MGFDDLNDTLRQGGEDAARARSDNARSRRKPNGGGEYVVTPDELLKQAGPGFQLRAQPLPDILPSPGLPWEVADRFFKRCCLEEGVQTLAHWRGSWLQWRRARWVETPDRVVRGWLWRFASKAKYTNKDGEQVLWAPNQSKVSNLAEGLMAICAIDDAGDQPNWLDERAAGAVISCRNGLLEVAKRTLIAHTPLFFNSTFVPFDYDPKAPRPEAWLVFLGQVFPSEREAIDALQEWFGYVLSSQTDLHKILLMIGPPRGGKGVISRVLRALIGPDNCCGPTLSSLGEPFGLAPLFGKSLAIVADARFAPKNGAVVIERLLSISGGDALTIDRKYKEPWTGPLPSRFHIISNEFPSLGDASQAIVSRLVVIPTTESWLDKEDHTLEGRLHKELPGILNWALAGLARLTDNKGRFTRVPCRSCTSRARRRRPGWRGLARSEPPRNRSAGVLGLRRGIHRSSRPLSQRRRVTTMEPFTRAELIEELKGLQRARRGGTAEVSYQANGVTRTVRYRSDDDIRAAIADIEDRLSPRRRNVVVRGVRGWEKPEG